MDHALDAVLDQSVDFSMAGPGAPCTLDMASITCSAICSNSFFFLFTTCSLRALGVFAVRNGIRSICRVRAGSIVCASLFDEWRNPTMTKRDGQGVRRTAATKGQEIVEGLRELSDTLQAVKPLESRFTVRTYRSPHRLGTVAQKCVACGK
jgi:hypothetical protein